MTRGYDYKKYAILYVDDEEQSLKWFGKAFSKEFLVWTASSVAEAMERLEQEGSQIGVLITDQRMPGQTGVDLLSHVRRSHPSVVRMLTTAYSDLESAIDAVNSGAIYQYVTKPWDLRDLRTTLSRAMDLFLIQQERDLLLREKLGVLQRLVITDRVRSLAMLAGGLAHHIRNSTTALSAFLDMAMLKPLPDPDQQLGAESLREDLLALARKENGRLLRIVRDVADTTIEPSPVFADVERLADLLSPCVDSARRGLSASGGTLQMSLDPALPSLRVDAAMVRKLFTLLLLRIIRQSNAVTITARDTESVWGCPGVCVAIRCDAAPWSDDLIASFFTLFSPTEDDPGALGTDLLSAYFIAHHHGGDIVVNQQAPDGPGFEVHLPLDPREVQRPALEDNCLEKLFTHFEAWNTLLPVE